MALQMQNSVPDCWETWFESNGGALEEQTTPHPFSLICLPLRLHVFIYTYNNLHLLRTDFVLI